MGTWLKRLELDRPGIMDMTWQEQAQRLSFRVFRVYIGFRN